MLELSDDGTWKKQLAPWLRLTPYLITGYLRAGARRTCVIVEFALELRANRFTDCQMENSCTENMREAGLPLRERICFDEGFFRNSQHKVYATNGSRTQPFCMSQQSAVRSIRGLEWHVCVKLRRRMHSKERHTAHKHAISTNNNIEKKQRTGGEKTILLPLETRANYMYFFFSVCARLMWDCTLRK